MMNVTLLHQRFLHPAVGAAALVRYRMTRPQINNTSNKALA